MRAGPEDTAAHDFRGQHGSKGRYCAREDLSVCPRKTRIGWMGWTLPESSEV